MLVLLFETAVSCHQTRLCCSVVIGVRADAAVALLLLLLLFVIAAAAAVVVLIVVVVFVVVDNDVVAAVLSTSERPSHIPSVNLSS